MTVADATTHRDLTSKKSAYGRYKKKTRGVFNTGCKIYLKVTLEKVNMFLPAD